MKQIDIKNVVDLNADLGEGIVEADKELPAIITSANISCCAHTKDVESMDSSISAAKCNGVSIGAHISYFDPSNFGRKTVAMTSRALIDLIKAELNIFESTCCAHRAEFCYVKPHGALYNQGTSNKRVANAIVRSVFEYNRELYLLCPYNSAMHRCADEIGLKCAFEFFADRAYTDRGRLVDRGVEGAVLTDVDEIVERTIKAIKTGKVMAVTGREVSVRVNSVCVHGDTPNAVAIAKRLRTALINEGIKLKPFV